jgi:hypothetical protein
MLLTEKLNEDGLELYFKYEHLDIETILRLFRNLNQLHGIIVNTTSPVYFNEDTKERFRNILDLTEIQTGQSIRIKLSEKWKVELPFRFGKVEGTFPKKLGVPLIITVFVLVAARQALGIYNEYLDTQLKQLEIEAKKNELYQQMEERRRIEPEFRSATREATKTIYYIMDNPDITYFEFNGIPIKDERNNRQ